MSTLSVTDRATPQLNQLISRIANPTPGLLIAGRAVNNLLRSHFRQKDANEPNKLGGERTHYWLGVAHAINVPQATGLAQVTVSISHPSFMQKVKGGQISAKRVSMLTIPIDKRAYGRAASVLERALGIKLFVIAKGSRVYLAARIKEGQGNPLRVFYALKRSVNQKPDSTALPPDEKITQAATDSFGDWVKRSTT